MIVNTDISALWSLQLNDTPLAACYDTRIIRIYESDNKIRDTFDKAGINISKYFNSGMLVLNLKQLRELEKPLSETSLTFLRENPEIPLLDQDILNWFCQENYTRADEKYNIFADRKDAERFIDDCVIHYAGGIKPWKEWHGSADIPYWEYFRKTPWCEDISTFYSCIRSLPNVPVSLPLLETDFFAYISGTRRQKIRYAAHFVFCIVKSFINGVRKTGTKTK